ncbi:hypothetical protein BTVI_39876 [Pitangus sulphuratus]|nr:hypothetical protein BTVI_39876 [Pitangus sulphuratus]
MNRDAVIPIHKMIRKLESQGVVSKTHSPFNSPIWPSNKLFQFLAFPGIILVSLTSADIIVWEDTAEEVFKKGKKIIQILLKTGFDIKKSKVKGPAREIQFLGVKWQDGRLQIPTKVINKIVAMAPPTNKKETQAFLGAVGFWRMHIPEYSKIVRPLYFVTCKKNNFHWGPVQQQDFKQIKQEIAHAIALGPVQTGSDVKNILYSAARDNGPSWNLWQKVPGETQGQPLGFWNRSYRGSEANYTPMEKEILATCEGIQAASDMIGTEAQLLLAPQLPVLSWMFKGKGGTKSGKQLSGVRSNKWQKLLKEKENQANSQNSKPSNWPWTLPNEKDGQGFTSTLTHG